MTHSPKAPGDFSPEIFLHPHVRHYDWGGRGKNSFLRRWLGSKDLKTPFAEAWFGTHPDGPTRVGISGPTLREMIKRNPSLFLKDPKKTELPFLLKLIEVRCPLSLQVHPGPREALQGFRVQGKGEGGGQGKIFKDPNGKPEILVALSPFDLFCGLRPMSLLRRDPLCRGILSQMGFNLGKGRPPLKKVFFQFPNLSQAELFQMGRRIFSKPSRWTLREDWLWKLWRVNQGGAVDPSIFVLPFLSFYRLKKGEAVSIPPGTLHVYVRGLGLEIMAPSDNVFRLGLTQKPVQYQRGVESLKIQSVAPVLPSPTGKLQLFLSKIKVNVEGLSHKMREITVALAGVKMIFLFKKHNEGKWAKLERI